MIRARILIGLAIVGGLAITVVAARTVLTGTQARARKAAGESRAVQPQITRFARVRGTRLVLALPAQPPELIGIGFHQAENPRSYELVPLLPWLSRDDSTEAAHRVLKGRGREVVMFQMNSRGRGTKQTTAADVVVKDRTMVVSPLDGRVTLIKHYRLYGRYDDLHVEIEPDGYPQIRMAVIHIQDLAVKAGDRVAAGRTALGRPRRFTFDAQVDRYVGGRVEHVHFQLNPYPPAPQ